MTEYPDLGVKHTCNRDEYCHLSQHYKLWFCSMCKVVSVVEINGEKIPLSVIPDKYKQKEYSDETLNNSV